MKNLENKTLAELDNMLAEVEMQRKAIAEARNEKKQKIESVRNNLVAALNHVAELGSDGKDILAELGLCYVENQEHVEDNVCETEQSETDNIVEDCVKVETVEENDGEVIVEHTSKPPKSRRRKELLPTMAELLSDTPIDCAEEEAVEENDGKVIVEHTSKPSKSRRRKKLLPTMAELLSDTPIKDIMQTGNTKVTEKSKNSQFTRVFSPQGISPTLTTLSIPIILVPSKKEKNSKITSDT